MEEWGGSGSEDMDEALAEAAAAAEDAHPRAPRGDERGDEREQNAFAACVQLGCEKLAMCNKDTNGAWFGAFYDPKYTPGTFFLYSPFLEPRNVPFLFMYYADSLVRYDGKPQDEFLSTFKESYAECTQAFFPHNNDAPGVPGNFEAIAESFALELFNTYKQCCYLIAWRSADKLKEWDNQHEGYSEEFPMIATLGVLLDAWSPLEEENTRRIRKKTKEELFDNWACSGHADELREFFNQWL